MKKKKKGQFVSENKNEITEEKKNVEVIDYDAEIKAAEAKLEELKKAQVAKIEEEKALWGKLSDNYCGPGFEYELTYNGGDYENSRIVPAMRQAYDGDYVETGFILTGTYNGDFWYNKAPTYEDVLEFLGEDHLTEEGAERFIADDKKKEDSEFVEFLTNKYEEEAVDK